LRQRLHEYGEASLRALIVPDARERADAPHRLALLRACRERPGCGAAEKRYELASFHCPTTSGASGRKDSTPQLRHETAALGFRPAS
jgi:hypothetical protein